MTSFRIGNSAPFKDPLRDSAASLADRRGRRRMRFGLRTQGGVATDEELPIATAGSVLSHRTSGFGDEVLLLGLRFELFVDDIEASVSFYGATLGLVPPENWSPEGYVPLRAGAVTVSVQNHTKLPVEHHFSASHLAGPRGVGLEIVIEVDDVDRAYAPCQP